MSGNEASSFNSYSLNRYSVLEDVCQDCIHLHVNCVCITGNNDHNNSPMQPIQITSSDRSHGTLETIINDGVYGAGTVTPPPEITNPNMLSNIDISDIHILSSNYAGTDNDRHDRSASNSSKYLDDSSGDMTNLGLRTKGSHIGHINIQGLSGKIDQLNVLLQSNPIHIMGISETNCMMYIQTQLL